MVVADSHGITRAPSYSGPPLRKTPRFRLPDSHRLRSAIPNQFDYPQRFITPRRPRWNQQWNDPTTPHTQHPPGYSHAYGLACSPFAHHYSGNHNCFLFLRVLRCFTSPRPHQPPYTFRRRRHPITSARLPHSETPGSKPGCRLPEEYRRLPRPSSDPDAKASTMRPQQLENTKTTNKNAKILAPTIQQTKTSTPPQPPANKRKPWPAQENNPTKKMGGPFPQNPNSVPTQTCATTLSPPHTPTTKRQRFLGGSLERR